MHKWVVGNAVMVVLTLCSAVALPAQTQVGNYSSANEGAIRRAAASKPATGALYDVGAYPTFRPALAPGDGSREVNTYCNICHTPRYITMQPALPAGAWADEVTKMVKTYGAVLPEDAAQKITAYLQSHYSREARKQ